MTAKQKPERALTPQQERFAQLVVLHGLLPSVAYRKAFKADAKAETVWVNSSKLMAETKVQLRLEELRLIAADKLSVSVERIAQELARIAFFDPRAMFDETGELLPIEEWPEDAARAVAGIEVKDLFDGKGAERKHVGQLHKVRISPKTPALEILAKWKRMLVERFEWVNNDDDLDKMSDSELEAEIRANRSALAAIEKAAAKPSKAKG